MDILAFMVLRQRRYKAVIHLAGVLLKPIALAANEPFKDELPSNINWPAGCFDKRFGSPIELERTFHVRRRPLDTPLASFDSRDHESEYNEGMETIWSLLADLVIAAPNQSSSEGKQVMNTVHQILALLHSLGLVPNTIYAYKAAQETTTTQQPPVLHLLNSRILSTLSDAVWNSHQDEEAEQSKKNDSNRWNFFREPPGRRLRSRGRELGPEIWLEFILWCCVEGGFASTGARIIKAIRDDPGNSWRAVSWAEASVPSVQFDQPSSRRRASYPDSPITHRARAVTHDQHKFVSTEAVLAVADCLITNSAAGGSDNDLSVLQTQRRLNEVLSFLEPHSLVPAYFDYLAVRLLQTGRLYGADRAHSLRNWASTINQLHSVFSTDEEPRRGPGLAFDIILDRSELRAGILHQVLQACVEAHLVKRAVDTFTDIQRTVDGNKLQAVGEFLTQGWAPQYGFFTSRPRKGERELLNSYGQLPTYKLPPFLDLITWHGLFGLGDWLLFSNDVDGTLLPAATWGQPSVTAALSKYAAAKDDPHLLVRSLMICASSSRKMTVNVLRALVVYYIKAYNWTRATELLEDLRKADAGGYSPKIVSNLAATILRLELNAEFVAQEDSHSDLSHAMLLLNKILNGVYDSPPAVFRVGQKKTFRQQIGYLLRILENLPDSSLSTTATEFRSRFPVSNEPRLVTDTFNVLFLAIAETKGLMEARNIWHLFCTDPRDYSGPQDDEFYDNEETPLDADAGGEDDEFKFSGTRPTETFHRDDHDELPLELANGDLNEASRGRSPVVVPDLRTLQILFRQAITEIGIREERRQAHDDLDYVFAWVKQYYGAFGLTAEDVKTELKSSQFLSRILKDDTKASTSFPFVSGKRAQERVGPNVAGQFSRGAFKTRLPGVKRASKGTARASKEDDHDDLQKEEKKLLYREVMPDLKIRKFTVYS